MARRPLIHIATESDLPNTDLPSLHHMQGRMGHRGDDGRILDGIAQQNRSAISRRQLPAHLVVFIRSRAERVSCTNH